MIFDVRSRFTVDISLFTINILLLVRKTAMRKREGTMVGLAVSAGKTERNFYVMTNFIPFFHL